MINREDMDEPHGKRFNDVTGNPENIGIESGYAQTRYYGVDRWENNGYIKKMRKQMKLWKPYLTGEA